MFNVSYFPYLGQITYKIWPQNARFSTCFVLKLWVKKWYNILILSVGFQMLKILFFQMALNRCELWSKGIKIAFFPKNFKKLSSVWELCPQTLIGLRLEDPPPDLRLWYVIRLSYTSLLNSFSQFRYFHFLTFGSSPLLLAKILFKCHTLATASDLPFYDIFVLQKVPLSKNFDDVVHTFCGLPLPPLKNPGYD